METCISNMSLLQRCTTVVTLKQDTTNNLPLFVNSKNIQKEGFGLNSPLCYFQIKQIFSSAKFTRVLFVLNSDYQSVILPIIPYKGDNSKNKRNKD